MEPADLEMRGEEVVFNFEDGVQSDGWILDGGKEDGPTVVIVHGYGDSRYGSLSWAKRVEEQKVARKIVVFDQRGQGESTGRLCDLGVREPGDVKKVVDQMAIEGKVVLFGCSMGAGTAIAAGGMMGERVVGVIADGPYVGWREPVGNVMRMKKYPTWPCLGLAGLILNVKLGGKLFKLDRTADAAKLSCPLLVFHGKEDRVCDYDSGEKIAGAAKCGKLVSFEGAGHLELAEVDPVRYGEELRRFFRSL